LAKKHDTLRPERRVTMNETTLIQAFDVIERHGRTMFAELRDLAEGRIPGLADTTLTTATDELLKAESGWREVERLVGQTYSWPPDAGGNEEYDPFVLYRTNGMTLALAHNVEPVIVKELPRKQIWVFQMGEGGGSKRPITPFVAADDYATTNELVAIIRGNGETGRQMFGPTEQLPAPYDELRVEILGDRIHGHYNKWSVVAREDDPESMLRHGAAQIRMRGW
jgi:hypothetical protein